MHLQTQSQVGDLMSHGVAALSPALPFKQVVREMTERGVGALPVVDLEGRVLGVVSEADLLLKEEHTDPLARGAWFERRPRKAERAKARALTAADLMTAPAVTVAAGASLTYAARLMHEKRVKQLVVVDGAGRLVGILSRGDVIRVFLRPDLEIRRAVLDGLAREVLWLEVDDLEVGVEDGVVTLGGRLDRRSDTTLLARLAADVDGVVAVVNHLAYSWDDSRPASPPPVPGGPDFSFRA